MQPCIGKTEGVYIGTVCRLITVCEYPFPVAGLPLPDRLVPEHFVFITKLQYKIGRYFCQSQKNLFGDRNRQEIGALQNRKFGNRCSAVQFQVQNF